MKSRQLPIDSPSMFAVDKPGLLVSVRNTEEALQALEGGANVIDVKEPNRGSLGAADSATILEIARAVNGRAHVTAAMGELVEQSESQFVDETVPHDDGISLFKIGLSQCGALRDWQALWSNAIGQMATRFPNARPVAVLYADWHAANAPPPLDVLKAGVEQRCPALLIDTWNKSAGSLFRHWPINDLRTFLANVRSNNMAVVLAGSLAVEDFPAACDLRPDLIAVRGAACIGGRGGTVAAKLVQQLKLALAKQPQAATRQSLTGLEQWSCRCS